MQKRPKNHQNGGKKQKQGKPSNSSQRDHSPKLARANLYGFHAVREAWLNETRTIKALYATEQGLNTFQTAIEQSKTQNIDRPAPQILDKQHLEKLLPQGAVHQGLALHASDTPETSVQDFIISAQNATSCTLVMLDQVTDPHNIGAILRSACGFGLNGMIMQRKHAPTPDGVLAKTACGAVEHVPIAYETNLNRTLEDLKEAGFFIYGLDERGEDIGGIESFPPKSCLVMGAEGPGLRRLVKENCDTLLRLPMSGPIPSLNVSNAAAVAFYAVTSKR